MKPEKVLNLPLVGDDGRVVDGVAKKVLCSLFLSVFQHNPGGLWLLTEEKRFLEKRRSAHVD